MSKQKQRWQISVVTIALYTSVATLLGCNGYHLYDNAGLSAQYSSISVPYVEGDLDGSLTASIIQQFVSKSPFRYQQAGGSIILRAKLIDYRDENIGFRYDRRKDGTLRKSIIPSESRGISTLEVAVEDAGSHQIILGPVRISASIDFDHDFEYARNEVNVFSLGQLSDFDQAVDAAQTPLNEVVARKVVDFVTNSW